MGPWKQEHEVAKGLMVKWKPATEIINALFAIITHLEMKSNCTKD